MIGTLLTALGNLIIFVVVAVLVIVGVLLLFMRPAPNQTNKKKTQPTTQ